VTVVVPTRDAGRTLAACLQSIRAQTHPATELIVVDNQSVDDTWAIAEAFADQAQRGGPERSAQRNQGWRTGTGDVLLFIDADMVLEADVVAEAVAVLAAAGPDIGALVIPEVAFGQGYLARCRTLEKAIYQADGRAEAARVYPRAVLERVGGFAEDLNGFEDWELTDRVIEAGYRIGRIHARVWHDEGRVKLSRAYRKKRYYGQWLPMYRKVRHGTTRRRLAVPALLTHPLQLARAPHWAVGLLILKSFEWAGALAGARRAKRGR
jgi:arabinofuranan 3-O-arabinosyltransferase